MINPIALVVDTTYTIGLIVDIIDIKIISYIANINTIPIIGLEAAIVGIVVVIIYPAPKRTVLSIKIIVSGDNLSRPAVKPVFYIIVTLVLS